MRIGTGWDIHRLVENRPLMIGGVHIPHHLGESGHSDGDVLIHAIVDAILGAAALGDIGTHFPPSDQRWKDVSSMELLHLVMDKISDWEVVNIDTTVILEKPKLGPFIKSIRDSIAETMLIPVDRISVKAKTAENLLDDVGSGKAIVAQASVLLKAIPTESEEYLDEWV